MRGPGLGRLLWMLAMQPLQLRSWLLECGIDSPNASLWTWVRIRHRAKGPVLGYLVRMTVLLWSLGILGALMSTGFLLWAGSPVLTSSADSALQGPLLVMLLGAGSAGLVGLLVALFGDLVLGVGIAAALAITLPSTLGMLVAVGTSAALEPFDVAIVGLAGGTISSLALDASRGITLGEPRSFLNITFLSLVGGLAYAGVLRLMTEPFDPQQALAVATAAGLAFGSALFLTSSRLILFPIEAALQLALYSLQLWRGMSTLSLAPVLYHDLGRLPHPGLFRHIVLGLESDPELAGHVRAVCQQVPGQHPIAARLIPYLQARQLQTLAEARDFAGLIRLRGDFLPGVEGAAPWQLTLRESARFLQAAQATSTPYLRLQHLRSADETIATLEAQILTDAPRLHEVLRGPIRALRMAADEARRATEAEASTQILNPFRAGDPLTPELGGELFVGRREIVREIEELLVNPLHSFSLALLGPRRCGKTSLLRMLPVLLPDAFCVFFDLQANPVDTPEAFFRALAERACEQARRDRRIEIPPLPPGPPFEVATRWLDQLEEIGRQRRILLCFDEFETLENTFPGEPKDLERLLGLLRAFFQHSRSVRLLVSGASPFDELGPLWNSFFINLRELRIGHLEESRALHLLTRPIPEFPPDAISRDVAAAIFSRTGGQPFLLQLYGSVLVARLNESGAQRAARDDLAMVDEKVLTAGRSYFAHTVQTAPEEARRVLAALAQGRAPAMSKSARNWLRRRSLIDETGGLLIPILGQWMREEGDAIEQGYPG